MTNGEYFRKLGKSGLNFAVSEFNDWFSNLSAEMHECFRHSYVSYEDEKVMAFSWWLNDERETGGTRLLFPCNGEVAVVKKRKAKAIQFDGKNIYDVIAFIENHGIKNIVDGKNNTMLLLKHIETGDWVVHSDDGEFPVLSDELFRKRYEFA